MCPQVRVQRHEMFHLFEFTEMRFLFTKAFLINDYVYMQLHNSVTENLNNCKRVDSSVWMLCALIMYPEIIL